MLARFVNINRCACATRVCLKLSTRGLSKVQNLENSETNSTKSEISTTAEVTKPIAHSKYEVFKDEDAEIILDVYEERLKYANLLEEDEEIVQDEFEGINLERGIYGVYDIEDLVEVLKRENAIDLFVASVPGELNYVDYICVVTAKSNRHMKAISQFVRRVFKQKRHKSDLVPKLEGENSKDWMALDLGNIALHIFSSEARVKYDLESLWSVGPKYDKEYNKQDPVADMLEKHSYYLHDLQPAS